MNEARVAAQNYYATEEAGAQAFNAEAVRTQQEQKQALEQQQRIQQEQKRVLEEQQLATERQAILNTQRQQANRQHARQAQMSKPRRNRSVAQQQAQTQEYVGERTSSSSSGKM